MHRKLFNGDSDPSGGKKMAPTPNQSLLRGSSLRCVRERGAAAMEWKRVKGAKQGGGQREEAIGKVRRAARSGEQRTAARSHARAGAKR